MSLIEKQTLDRIISQRAATLAQARVALDEAQRKSHKPDLARQWAIIGTCHQFDGKLEEAKYAYLQVLKTMQDLEDSAGMGEALLQLGGLASSAKNYAESVDFYEQAIAVLKKARITDRLFVALSQLAYAAANGGNHQLAVSALEQALKLPESQTTEMRGALTERIALSLAAQGRYQVAIETYERALGLMDTAGFQRGRVQRLKHLAEIYQAAGDEQSANNTLKQAEKLEKKRLDNKW